MHWQRFTLRLGRFFSSIGYLERAARAHLGPVDAPLAYQVMLGNAVRRDDGVRA